MPIDNPQAATATVPEAKPETTPEVRPNPNLALWLEFAKPVVISGFFAAVIAIVPAWLNNQNRSTELKIAEKKANADIEMAKAKTKSDIDTSVITQDQQYVDKFLK